MASELDDLLDVKVLGARLRAGIRTLLVGTLMGLGSGAATLLVLPSRWEGRATVLTTRTSGGRGALLEQAGIPDAITSSGLMGSGAGSSMETQLELLRSRRLLEPVGDSLLVGVQVRAPRSVPPLRLLSSYIPRAPFAPVTLSATRVDGSRWRLEAERLDTTVVAGTPVTLAFAELTVAPTAPASFRVRLLDREDAMRRLEKRLSVDRAGGEIAEVTVRWDDSVSGAALANGVVAQYLGWRQREDRGDNRTRYEFVRAQADSVEQALTVALDTLRRFQEATKALDPAIYGKSLMDVLLELRSDLAEASVESEALGALLARVGRTDASTSASATRELPGYPALQRSPALNELVAQLSQLEGERTILLQTRTESDPTVAGRTAAIRALEAQLAPMAGTYRAAIEQRRSALAIQVDSIARLMAGLPGQGRRYFELSRDVQRLTVSAAQLAAQRLQLRLAVMGEGGGARQVDVASPTRRAVFPKVPLVLAIGTLAGLVSATLLVLARHPAASNAIRNDPSEATAA